MARKFSQILIPLRTCCQSSRGGWTNKNPQILTYSKHWLCRNGLPSVRIWPRSWLKAYQGELKRSWMRRVNTVNIESLHTLMQLSIKAIDIYETIVIILQYIIVTSEKKWYKNTEAGRLCENEYCVILKSFGHSCMQSLMLCFQASNVTLNLASRNFLPSLLNCNPSEIPRWDSKPPKSPLPKDDATSIRPHSLLSVCKLTVLQPWPNLNVSSWHFLLSKF